jgi:hypothetical protein
MTERHNKHQILDAITHIEDALIKLDSINMEGKHIYGLSIITIMKSLNKHQEYLEKVAQKLIEDERK